LPLASLASLASLAFLRLRVLILTFALHFLLLSKNSDFFRKNYYFCRNNKSKSKCNSKNHNIGALAFYAPAWYSYICFAFLTFVVRILTFVVRTKAKENAIVKIRTKVELRASEQMIKIVKLKKILIVL